MIDKLAPNEDGWFNIQDVAKKLNEIIDIINEQVTHPQFLVQCEEVGTDSWEWTSDAVEGI